MLGPGLLKALLLLLALHKSAFDRTAVALGLPHPLYDEALLGMSANSNQMKHRAAMTGCQEALEGAVRSAKACYKELIP